MNTSNMAWSRIRCNRCCSSEAKIITFVISMRDCGMITNGYYRQLCEWLRMMKVAMVEVRIKLLRLDFSPHPTTAPLLTLSLPPRHWPFPLRCFETLERSFLRSGLFSSERKFASCGHVFEVRRGINLRRAEQSDVVGQLDNPLSVRHCSTHLIGPLHNPHLDLYWASASQLAGGKP